jgi:hypothetical protein
MSEGLEDLIKRLMANPDKTKAAVREFIKNGGAWLSGLAKEVGIDDPKSFSEYVGVGAGILSFLWVTELSESSERLEDLTKERVERNKELVPRPETSFEVSARGTRALAMATGSLKMGRGS